MPPYRPPLFLRTRIRPFPRARGRKRKLFYRVFLFKNRDVMQAFRAAQQKINPSLLPKTKRFEACACYWEALTIAGGTTTRSNCIGQVLFHQKFIGGGVVAHEMTHAALYCVASRTKKGYELTAAQDEVLARTVHALCRAFWNHWWKWQRRGWVK